MRPEATVAACDRTHLHPQQLVASIFTSVCVEMSLQTAAAATYLNPKKETQLREVHPLITYGGSPLLLSIPVEGRSEIFTFYFTSFTEHSHFLANSSHSVNFFRLSL
jgi:hypothetical protein